MKNGRKPLKCPIPSVEKAFAILEHLTANNEGATISELSRLFRLPVSTTNNLIYSLVYCGYLIRDSKGHFRTALKLLNEASKLVDNISLREVARTQLEWLSQQTGMASTLSILDENMLVCIDKVEGTSQIRMAASVGRRFYTHAVAPGKVLLANLGDTELDALVQAVGMPAVTSQTITSLSLLRKELRRVRVQGYAIEDGENVVGIRGVGAAIFDHEGRVAAALSTGGFGVELDDNIKSVIELVREAAAAISERLGYREMVVGPASLPSRPQTSGKIRSEPVLDGWKG
jgi:DNA-binding IclR family transcriptional regulator